MVGWARTSHRPYYGRASPADSRIYMVRLTSTIYTRLKRLSHNLSYILAQGAGLNKAGRSPRVSVGFLQQAWQPQGIAIPVPQTGFYYISLVLVLLV